MKVTKEQSAENRASLIRTASRLFKTYGIDGVGVADISKEAGLTHGALYAQFSSKDVLAAEALAHGLQQSTAKMRAVVKEREATLDDYLDSLLSKKHRDSIASGCPIAASGSEVARKDKAVSRSFAGGVEGYAGAFEATLGPAATTERERALAITAAVIGAIVVARGVAKADPELSEEVITAARRVLGELGGSNPRIRRRTTLTKGATN
jgi:TetR/AcrR family transcriptional repressor of nem operon